MGEEREFKAEEFKDVLADWKDTVNRGYYDLPDLLCFVGVELYHAIEDGFDDMIRTDGGRTPILKCPSCSFERDSFGNPPEDMSECPKCGGYLIYETPADNDTDTFGGDGLYGSFDLDSDSLSADNFALVADSIELTVDDELMDIEEDLITERESSIGDMIHEQAKDKVSQGVDSISVFGIDIVLEQSLGDWECVLSPRISGERKLFEYVNVIESFRFPPRKVDPDSPSIVICAKCDEKTDDPAIVTETEAFCSIGCYL